MKGFVGRAIERDRTRLRARIDVLGQKSHGHILDLSRHGICLYLAVGIPVAPGDKITVETEEMGMVIGTIRWVRHPRVGAELVLTSNNRAKVESYYRFFRDNPLPIAPRITMAPRKLVTPAPRGNTAIARRVDLT